MTKELATQIKVRLDTAVAALRAAMDVRNDADVDWATLDDLLRDALAAAQDANRFCQQMMMNGAED